MFDENTLFADILGHYFGLRVRALGDKLNDVPVRMYFKVETEHEGFIRTIFWMAAEAGHDSITNNYLTVDETPGRWTAVATGWRSVIGANNPNIEFGKIDLSATDIDDSMFALFDFLCGGSWN